MFLSFCLIFRKLQPGVAYKKKRVVDCRWYDQTARSNRPDVFGKKGVLRNFAKFSGKHLCQSLVFNKFVGLRPTTLFKKRLWQRCFPVNFGKFLRTPFCIEHLWWLPLNYAVKPMYESVMNDGSKCNGYHDLHGLRSTRGRFPINKGVLKNFAMFTGKHLCWSLFLIKLQT